MTQSARKFPVLTLVLLTILLSTGIFGRALANGPAAPVWQGGNELEPNDTPAQANVIMVNESMNGQVPASDPSDIDYFVLTTDPGRQYEVRLDEAPVSGDYRFNLSLYDGSQNLISESETAGGDTSITWTAATDTYYFSVEAVDIDITDAPYELRVVRFPVTATATTSPSWDSCEVNDSLTGSWSRTSLPGGPCAISVGTRVSNLNFVPFTGGASPNPDFFLVSVKAGRNYRLETSITAGGVDTVVYLYSPGATDEGQYIAISDDAPGLGLGSRIEWTPPADGIYLIKVENREPLPHENDETYSIIVEDVSPTLTPTSTPATGTPTVTSQPPSIPGSPDVFEPNWWFDRASLIGLDVKYTNLNFVPWAGTDEDTDFYKLWVVAGKLYTCETSELGTATNTNIIFCSGPSWEQCFAGNDDVEPFDPADPYRSRLKFFASYTNYLYIVVGQVGSDRILPEEWADLSYSLRCYIEQPGTATPTPTGQYTPPTNTPRPTATSPGDVPVTDTPVPPATPTPVQLGVTPMTTPAPPVSTPAVTPTPVLYDIGVLLYYDQNRSGQADPDEGISSALVRTHDALSGELLSVGYTDETGTVALRFPLSTLGPVRVSVPFFGFSQIVTTADADIQIRISPRP